MSSFDVEDRVRVDIPDKTDLDYEDYHGVHGRIIERIDDDLGSLTGDQSHSVIYRVKFDTGDVMDFRERNLRPPLE